jgi:hypothetical protein
MQLATALPIFTFENVVKKLPFETRRPLREHRPQYSRREVVAIGKRIILGFDGMPTSHITVDHCVHLCCLPFETKRLNFTLISHLEIL